MNSLATVEPFDPNLDLILEREVDVPRESVWAAWTRPELLKKWFTPAPWTTVDCEIDLRPGGIFRTRFSGSGRSGVSQCRLLSRGRAPREVSVDGCIATRLPADARHARYALHRDTSLANARCRSDPLHRSCHAPRRSGSRGARENGISPGLGQGAGAIGGSRKDDVT